MKTTPNKIEAAKKAARERGKASVTKSITIVSKRKGQGDVFEEDPDQPLWVSKIAALQMGLPVKDADGEREYLAKAINTDDGVAAGFLIPPQVDMQVIQRLREDAVVRNMPGVKTATVVDGTKITGIRHTAGPAITYGKQGDTITEDTTLNWDQVQNITFKGSAIVRVTQEMLAAPTLDLEAQIQEYMSKEFALDEDLQILEGLGGDKPLGMFYHPGVLKTTLNATPTFDTFVDAETQVNLQNAEVTGWITNNYTKQTLRKLKDSGGRMMWNALNNIGSTGVTNRIDMVNGVPIEWTNQVSSTLRTGTDESYIVGGQWDNLVIGQSPNGIRISSSSHAGFAEDEIHLKFVRWVGYMLQHPEAFVVIKDVKR